MAQKKSRDNLEEEFADVLAWLCTLANINDVDLASAVQKVPVRRGRDEAEVTAGILNGQAPRTNQ